jgi:DNA-directed RNA polymerase specialized sigma24 family protein
MKADLEAQFQHFAENQVLTLRRFAYLLCADWHVAEDLVQNALLKLYRLWPKMQRRGSVGNYARRAVLTCWLDEKRRPWRRTESGDGELPDQADPAVDIDGYGERLVDRERVLRGMTELPPATGCAGAAVLGRTVRERDGGGLGLFGRQREKPAVARADAIA